MTIPLLLLLISAYLTAIYISSRPITVPPQAAIQLWASVAALWLLAPILGIFGYLVVWLLAHQAD